VLVALALTAPAAVAADDALRHSGRVLIATEGDITLPAGEHANLVVVTRGTATIHGEANTVVVVDGVATLTGARTETVFAIRSPVTVGPGSVVLGEVLKLDADVTRVGNGVITGGVRDIGLDAAGIGLFLGPALVLLYIGFAIAAIAAGLLLAALAARQVRSAERLISQEPVTTFLAGVAGVFGPILLVAGLFVTIVGAPLAVAILIGVLPAAAFGGYLVAGIWIGDWLLTRMSAQQERERPYLAAVIGLGVLQLLGIWPFFTMLASLFGYGALVLLAWRTFRGEPRAPVPAARRAPAAMAG
jgi:hypothetical protein